MKHVALAAVGAAVLGLAACSQSSAPAAGPASHRTVSVPISCAQQYHAWQQGKGKGVMAALHTVSAAGTAENRRTLAVVLKKAQPAVAKAARHPVPACADPRGYWNVLLMHVTAATASKGSATSARAAMKDVPKIEHELASEVKSVSQ